MKYSARIAKIRSYRPLPLLRLTIRNSIVATYRGYPELPLTVLLSDGARPWQEIVQRLWRGVCEFEDLLYARTEGNLQGADQI